MPTEKDAIGMIAEYTGKRNVRLTERGNFAIFAAMHLAARLSGNETILVPDQGGWISFETYPKLAGIRTVKIRTDSGLIDLDDLKEKIRNEKPFAFIVTSLAGYCAEQEMEKIHTICKEKGCLLIEDATGIIGKKTYGDIVVGSFGHWKPVDLGYGGFIASDYSFSAIDDIFSMSKTNFDYGKLLKRLRGVKKRTLRLERRCADVKKDLRGFDILHSERKGLNVIVRFRSEDERKKIIAYCGKEGLEYVLCPKNIRVMDDAVSIEVKRLD